MSARKLQVEIEKTFKKVTDGIAIFDEVYEKLSASNSVSQKEKLEGDLKTQIKKLQRLRDQIKTWASSNDIKDKKALLENRRLIEAKMEEFKAVEREMKIKAFSKEGLSIASKLDPKEKEKQDTIQWISNAVEELERQAELIEAEAESLKATFKRGKKDLSKLSHLSELESRIERHKWHQDKLELIMRRLENSQISPEAVNDIQEDIMYYVECSQSEDFAEDENLYDELNLDEASASYDAERSGRSSSSSHSPSPSASSSSSSENLLQDKAEAEEKVSADASVQDIAEKESLDADKELATNDQEDDEEENQAETQKDGAISNNENMQSEVQTTNPSASTSAVTNITKPTLIQNPSTPLSVSNSKVASPETPNATHTAPKVEMRYASAAAAAAAALAKESPSHHYIMQQVRPETPNSPRLNSTVIQSKWDSLGHTASPKMQTQPVRSVSQSSATTETNVKPTKEENADVPVSSPDYLKDLVNALNTSKEQHKGAIDKEKLTEALNISCVYVPDATDAAKPQYYIPKDPYPVPHYYPQQPLPLFDSSEMTELVDPDTLFYMFYYRPGTYQQYIAGQELKKQSWRFHKKYTTWFQRHEEPKMITDEFESGSYRYFDFEGDWVQRKKADFRFTYQYLEDDDDWTR
ncbi:CCR4-Not complex NOT box subunit 3/5 [Schizosaccharomyces pombe]|uniref:General negative regulator of transcription subunit 3 n=1 Tax=Schizosaccharomyces pombe (strain 972 / ATCC 24843) TaxID=284812 RepID=NOT3_SCHPO|nr:putative CCR4-Not complex subunit Not3/5 [Schizosaccharomyces pombe]O13870.2 RecName: Full=General negative regulator of transcription subunit 3 [Schizosaccharomyces pombe 972h-]CAB11234.2 CCR4-Not complex subunit Not3/5 (predicted) [Schizosaccharomyces pombe]|eukprot:NP_594789.2 putative CCR4-Not complex subunit Not3/5 [Schizosaccharomyces pombe]